MRVAAILPARWASVRFPGKPLADLLGKAVIEHTATRAGEAQSVDAVAVATDDERIAAAVRAFGGRAVLTESSCASGTARIAQAADRCRDLDGAEIIVNVQGDEPLVDPAHLDACVAVLRREPDLGMATICTPLRPEDAEDRNAVKCVVTRAQRALYFSRALIPHSKGGGFDGEVPYLRHVGLYAFRRDFLRTFVGLPDGVLAAAEDLEQLRVLEAGHAIGVAVVDRAERGVDCPADLDHLRAVMLAQQA